MKLKKFHLILFLPLLIFIFILSIPVFGEEDSSGRDVFLLIDNSGSMKSSDPENLRWAGGELLVDMLDSDDRLAVISFSSEAEVLAPLTRLGSGTSKSELKELFDSMEVQGGTDLLEALITASEEIEDRGEERDVSLVVMSDGVIDLSETSDDVDTDNYMERLMDRGEWLQDRGVTVHGISFSREDEEVLMPFVNSTGGEYHYIENENELISLYYKIIAEAEERDVETAGETREISVDTFIDELTVTAVGTRSANEVNIFDPDGKRVTNDTPGVNIIDSEYYKVFRIDKPDRGTWNMSVPDEDIEILVEREQKVSIQPVGVLQSRTLPVNEACLLQLKVDSLSGYDNIAAKLQFIPKGGGKTLNIPLYDDGTHGDLQEGDGIFSAKYTFEETEEYDTSAVIYNNNDPVAARTASHEVRPLPKIQVNTLRDQAHVDNPFTLQAELTHNGKRLIGKYDIEAVVRSGDREVEVVPLNDTGEDGDLKKEDGLYTAKWYPEQAGEFEMQYRATGKFMDEAFVLYSEAQPVTIYPTPSMEVNFKNSKWDIINPNILHLALSFDSRSIKSEKVELEIEEDGWQAVPSEVWVKPMGQSDISIELQKDKGADTPADGLTLNVKSDIEMNAKTISVPVPRRILSLPLIIGGAAVVLILIIWLRLRRIRLSGVLIFEEPHGERVINLKEFKKRKATFTYKPGEAEGEYSEEKAPIVLALKKLTSKNHLFSGDIHMEVEQGELYRQDDSEYEAVTELLLSDGLKLIGEDITVTFLDWEDYDYDKQESLDERLNDYS